MKKNAVIVAAHDGLVSLVTGVGVVVHSFVESFEEIKQRVIILKNNNMELICLAPYLKKQSKDYNAKIKEKTEKICKLNSGNLINLPTFSDGSSQSSIWGGSNQWRSASLSVASYITAIYDQYDSMVLFAHDTIFSSVRKYTFNLDKLKIIWIPHSLCAVFKDEFCGLERLSIEKEAIKNMLKTKNDVIGYISYSFRDVLYEKYKVPDEKLIPFINGIYKRSSRFNISVSTIINEIRKNRIPLDKDIIFCWGRCVYQKGYDLLISTYKKFFMKHKNYHLVLLMPVETSPKKYVNKIKKQISALPNDCISAIYDFRQNLPYCVLKHPNLKFIVFPSRFEGGPLTPLEALSFTKEDVKFIYSAIPPLLEIFKGNKRGVIIKNLSIDSLYNAMETANKKKNIAIKRNAITNFTDSYVKGLKIYLRLLHNAI